jgi:hypothetical protein
MLFSMEITAPIWSLTSSFSMLWCQKFLVRDFLMENLSRETTIFTVSEGSEPQFFTRFFTSWDPAKSSVRFSWFLGEALLIGMWSSCAFCEINYSFCYL